MHPHPHAGLRMCEPAVCVASCFACSTGIIVWSTPEQNSVSGPEWYPHSSTSDQSLDECKLVTTIEAAAHWALQLHSNASASILMTAPSTPPLPHSTHIHCAMPTPKQQARGQACVGSQGNRHAHYELGHALESEGFPPFPPFISILPIYLASAPVTQRQRGILDPD